MKEKTGREMKTKIQRNNCYTMICRECTRRKIQLTVDNVHLYAAGIRVARLAPIDPGVARYSFLDHQTTCCLGPLFRDETDTATWRIEIDNLDRITIYPYFFFFFQMMKLYA